MVSIESLYGKFPAPKTVKNTEHPINESGKLHFFNSQGKNVEVGDILKITRRFSDGIYIGEVNGAEVVFHKTDDIFVE